MTELTNDSSDSRTSRRTFLQLGTTVAAATTLGYSATSLGSASSKDTYKIREGTPDETEVVVIDSGTDGPTAVVVGGIHGNEPAGYKAAEQMRDWSIDEGTLVLIPKSNPVAIKNDTYENEKGNLNRQFPPGETPKTALARAIWGVITDHDADMVINLHSSQGIYKEDVGPDGVGQAIYPTTAKGASENATKTAEYMNENYMGDRKDYYRFKRGNLIDGTRPLLIHKVDADLNEPGFIVETTRYETELETRINWTLHIVSYLLDQYSIRSMSSGGSDDDSSDNGGSNDNGSSDDGSSDNGGSGDNSSGDGSSGDGSSDNGSSGDGSSGSDNDSNGGKSGESTSDLIDEIANENPNADWAQLLKQLFG